MKRELLYALRNARFDNHIVPVLYRACDPEMLSWALPTYQMADFTRDREKGFQELLRVWGLIYQQV